MVIGELIAMTAFGGWVRIKSMKVIRGPFLLVVSVRAGRIGDTGEVQDRLISSSAWGPEIPRVRSRGLVQSA
jgi:hypothetical protein